MPKGKPRKCAKCRPGEPCAWHGEKEQPIKKKGGWQLAPIQEAPHHP